MGNMAPEYNPSSQRLMQENCEFEAALWTETLSQKRKSKFKT